LVHYPINNKRGEVVTTSVTNLDIHDISRSCRTFGVAQYHIITPLKPQHELVQRILDHWEEDKSNAYNPDRQEALTVTKLSESLEASIMAIEKMEGVRPKIIVTGANFDAYDGKPADLREKLELDSTPYFLLFGTGWGLNVDVTSRADYRLAPITCQCTGYNHLSVRSAVAIYLYQLRGDL